VFNGHNSFTWLIWLWQFKHLRWTETMKTRKIGLSADLQRKP